MEYSGFFADDIFEAFRRENGAAPVADFMSKVLPPAIRTMVKELQARTKSSGRGPTEVLRNAMQHCHQGVWMAIDAARPAKPNQWSPHNPYNLPGVRHTGAPTIRDGEELTQGWTHESIFRGLAHVTADGRPYLGIQLSRSRTASGTLWVAHSGAFKSENNVRGLRIEQAPEEATLHFTLGSLEGIYAVSPCGHVTWTCPVDQPFNPQKYFGHFEEKDPTFGIRTTTVEFDSNGQTLPEKYASQPHPTTEP